jgi:hypothetical protein
VAEPAKTEALPDQIAIRPAESREAIPLDSPSSLTEMDTLTG